MSSRATSANSVRGHKRQRTGGFLLCHRGSHFVGVRHGDYARMLPDSDLGEAVGGYRFSAVREKLLWLRVRIRREVRLCRFDRVALRGRAVEAHEIFFRLVLFALPGVIQLVRRVEIEHSAANRTWARADNQQLEAVVLELRIVTLNATRGKTLFCRQSANVLCPQVSRLLLERVNLVVHRNVHARAKDSPRRPDALCQHTLEFPAASAGPEGRNINIPGQFREEKVGVSKFFELARSTGCERSAFRPPRDGATV